MLQRFTRVTRSNPFVSFTKTAPEGAVFFDYKIVCIFTVFFRASGCSGNVPLQWHSPYTFHGPDFLGLCSYSQLNDCT